MHAYFENIEQAGHLREDEHAGILRLEPRQKLLEQHQLAGVGDDVIAKRVERLVLDAVKKVWMVAGLAQPE